LLFGFKLLRIFIRYDPLPRTGLPEELYCRMGNKKAHPINQMSFELFEQHKVDTFKLLRLTYLSCIAAGWN
jgi:hypothetical protein